ncbi:Transcriptional regulator [Archaeoglobus sulfaticallidus PM70-1]|uniref:Transcriptional regulator n=2 Tax=Archaeoglobus TaxID=2233 RepID=N0BME7_9EURY|nr:Transcriptional regulator [Archaeoglobus sulfaticallidus PM70-1]
MKLDEIDILVLRVLAEDARTTLRELAEKTGLAVSTIHSRITKLISEGVIEKFAVVIDPEKFGYITSFILLDVDTAKTRDVLEELVKKECLLEVYESLGKFNIVLKVRVKDFEALRNFINEISEIDGVMEFEWFLTTKRYKEDTWKPEVEL